MPEFKPKRADWKPDPGGIPSASQLAAIQGHSYSVRGEVLL